jgi:hypothetical protein
VPTWLSPTGSTSSTSQPDPHLWGSVSSTSVVARAHLHTWGGPLSRREHDALSVPSPSQSALSGGGELLPVGYLWPVWLFVSHGPGGDFTGGARC